MIYSRDEDARNFAKHRVLLCLYSSAIPQRVVFTLCHCGCSSRAFYIARESEGTYISGSRDVSRDENITFVSRHSAPFVYVAKQKRGPFLPSFGVRKCPARIVLLGYLDLTCSAAVSNHTMRVSTKNLVVS